MLYLNINFWEHGSSESKKFIDIKGSSLTIKICMLVSILVITTEDYKVPVAVSKEMMAARPSRYERDGSNGEVWITSLLYLQ